ncbi:Hypothetical predicted protein [Olea europaea subsp. europaea]|uniref:Uncharacterized protein n=1 Tax=Olea europaea subsp. europaea TaxID=158383 RepID=A0A8S0PWK9_OLEEU|nr:Hypothetical predicted protein [Olea europaea subsp. europaea]
MEFQFLVPENVRLPARISQRSNLKYIKIVMDNFDDRLRADFRDSCLGFLTDVPEIQFSAQLIQALVCRGIRCNVQGHLTRFGLQEYAIVNGLHAGSFPEGDRYTDIREEEAEGKIFQIVGEDFMCPVGESLSLRVDTPSR